MISFVQKGGTTARSGFGLVVTALTVMLLASCDADIVDGIGSDGEVRTVVTSGVEDDATSAEPEGSVMFVASVTLIDDLGREIAISSRSVTGEVRIEGEDSSLVAQAEVRPGTYTRARVAFIDVDAEVEGGLSLDGVPFLGMATVDIGIEPVVVEAPVQLNIERNTSETLVIDLNAATWLSSMELLSGRVPAAAFRGAVELSVR